VPEIYFLERRALAYCSSSMASFRRRAVLADRDECLQHGLGTELQAFVGAVQNPIYSFMEPVSPRSVFACLSVSLAADFGQVDYVACRHASFPKGGPEYYAAMSRSANG